MTQKATVRGISIAPDFWCGSGGRRQRTIPPRVQDALDAKEEMEWERLLSGRPSGVPGPSVLVDVNFLKFRVTQVPDAGALGAYDLRVLVTVRPTGVFFGVPTEFAITGISGPTDVDLSGSRRVALASFDATFEISVGGFATIPGSTLVATLPYTEGSQPGGEGGLHILNGDGGDGWDYELHYSVGSVTAYVEMATRRELSTMVAGGEGAGSRSLSLALRTLSTFGVSVRQFNGPDEVVLDSPLPLKDIIDSIRRAREGWKR